MDVTTSCIRCAVILMTFGSVIHQLLSYALPVTLDDGGKSIYTSLISETRLNSASRNLDPKHAIFAQFINLSTRQAHKNNNLQIRETTISEIGTPILKLNLQRVRRRLSNSSSKVCNKGQVGLCMPNYSAQLDTTLSVPLLNFQSEELTSVAHHPYMRSDDITLTSRSSSKSQQNINLKTILYTTVPDNFKTINKTPPTAERQGITDVETTSFTNIDKIQSSVARFSSIKDLDKMNTQSNKKVSRNSEHKMYTRNKADTISTSTLRMVVELATFTIFYQGEGEGSPNFGNENIRIIDSSSKKIFTWFLLKFEEYIGNAYMESSSNISDSLVLQCLVRSTPDNLIYSGWHAWNHGNSGVKSLSCEPETKLDKVDCVSGVNFQLRLDSPPVVPEQGDTNINNLFTVKLSEPGLYVCIAVHSDYKVFLSPSHDVRVVKVLTSTSQLIIPKPVNIYQNEIMSSFKTKYCTGVLLAYQKSIKHQIREGDLRFIYVDKSVLVNESFTVKYLHLQKWIRPEPLFENVNLDLSIIFKCQFIIPVPSNNEKRKLDMYFRHDVIKNRTENIFTAVENETIHFNCYEDTSAASSKVGYLYGTCSENISSYSSDGMSSMTLTINEPVCVMCSSSVSQIKLQINVENDLRKLTSNTELNDNDACPHLEVSQMQHFSVKYSNICEHNAIFLPKGPQPYNFLSKVPQQYPTNKNMAPSHMYRSYYTSRQFIVCRSQPIPWSNINLNSSVDNPEDNFNTTKVIMCISAFMCLFLIWLIWRRNCRGMKILENLRQSQKSASFLKGSKRNQLTSADDIFSEMDCVHPRENIERSRISIAELVGSGKFSHVYKAYLNSDTNGGNMTEVAVKEYRKPVRKCDKNKYLCRINQEIQILRVILPHINVIKYYGFSSGVDSTLVVMELVNGVCLLEYLHEQRNRVPGFVVKTRSCNITDCRSDITDTTCLSEVFNSAGASCSNVVDPDDGVKASKDILPETRFFTEKDEFCVDSESVQIQTEVNERRDSEQSRDSLSELSELSQGIWNVNFEDDVCRYDGNTRRRSESCATNHSFELNNKIRKDNLVMTMASICRQVARGMAHLSSLNILHRDLAARNVITQLPAHPLVVKICDFGSAYRLQDGEVKYKVRVDTIGSDSLNWMSPESTSKGVFSVQSDIWSYGVLCWEIITLGSVPTVQSSSSLHRPSNCDEEVFAVVKSCWKIKPDERPSFETLSEMWSDVLEMNSDYLELWAEPEDHGESAANKEST